MHGPTRTDAHRSEESLTVLVVDDDEDDFALVRSLLAEADGRYAPTWVRDGATAVDLLRTGPFDVVLCDFRLGDRNGIEVLREIRELGVPTPVILLTGWGGRDVDLLAMRAGAADYLDKNGLTAELLDRSIRYAVEHATLLEALRESEARYELLAREVDEGLWEWDLATDVARYSPRWLRLLDLDPDDVPDTPQAFFARIHPDDHDTVRSHIDAHLGGGPAISPSTTGCAPETGATGGCAPTARPSAPVTAGLCASPPP
jgi:Response regulator containing CheY-like receiver, AAA-type ATPase, and DNA-binding domains